MAYRNEHDTFDLFHLQISKHKNINRDYYCLMNFFSHNLERFLESEENHHKCQT